VKTFVGFAAVVVMVGLVPADGVSRAARSPRCDTTLEPTPNADLPDDVAAFAQGTPIVGDGDLWLLLNRPSELDLAFDLELDQWELRKVVLYPRVPGPIEIVERRLGSARRITTSLEDDSFANGFTFRVTSFGFPRGGCWRITASLGDSRVRFHVRVPRERQPICDDLAEQLDGLRAIPNEANVVQAQKVEAALDDKGC
jgi:hypothetical protein